MKMPAKFLCICLLVYVPLQSIAWGKQGHRITGLIAERYLTHKAARNIRHILGDESIAMASNWADFIKSDSAYNYLSEWHYINLPDDLNYETMKNMLNSDSAADAYTKLIFLTAQLKDKNLPHEKQVMYLKLLIHIAEDVHQPMHVSREEDEGGNKIKVLWFNQPSNLHSVWDTNLIEEQQLSYTEYANAINHTSKAQRKAWLRQPISQWLYDSYTISQQLYAGIAQPNQKLGYRYNYDHLQTLNLQLLKGGVQLAGLLNEIFG